MTVLEKVQALVCPSAKHLSTLTALVEICKQDACDYCNLPEYNEKLDNAVVQMVVERFNKINNEGIKQTNASGIEETFIDGYSVQCLDQLKKYRKVRMV